jgi:hypothetical protein
MVGGDKTPMRCRLATPTWDLATLIFGHLNHRRGECAVPPEPSKCSKSALFADGGKLDIRSVGCGAILNNGIYVTSRRASIFQHSSSIASRQRSVVILVADNAIIAGLFDYLTARSVGCLPNRFPYLMQGVSMNRHAR